jgi:hypothetical protein
LIAALLLPRSLVRAEFKLEKEFAACCFAQFKTLKKPEIVKRRRNTI